MAVLALTLRVAGGLKASLGYAVSNVVPLGTQKKVSRVDTARVITAMKDLHARRYRRHEMLVAKPMGSNDSRPNPEGAVAKIHQLCALPLPASRFYREHLCPKSELRLNDPAT